MKTNQVYVNNLGKGMSEALNEAERFSSYQKLSKKSSIRIRLLTEETLSMVRAIVGDFNALFWIEGDMNECKICLEAKTIMDPEKRSGLMSVSTSGQNTEARGIMGKIMEMIETGREGKDAKKLSDRALHFIDYAQMGIDNADSLPQGVFAWSLNHYKESVLSSKDNDNAAQEAWDELERSIVANLADDVRVGIRKDRVDMVIIKKLYTN